MAVSFFACEIIGAFLLAAGILWSYGRVQKHTLPILLVVLIAWYFSLLIVTILPNDISATVYRQCKEQNRIPIAPIINVTTTQSPIQLPGDGGESRDVPVDVPPSYSYDSLPDDESIPAYGQSRYSSNRRREKRELMPGYGQTSVQSKCIEPPSYVDNDVVSIKVLYRLVYWTTQLLTWLLIPFLSAYVQAGEFTVLQKAKTALIDNAIYYGTYILIFVILLVYIAISTQYNLSFQNLKLIGISAANTWGLFLLVLLLGYGLVEIPRSFWYRSDIYHQIQREYFNLAKITEEKHEATEDLDGILTDVKKVSDNTRFGHPLRRAVNIICKKCPNDFQDSLCETENHEYNDANVPSERQLIRLHKRLNKSLQRKQRTQTQFALFLNRALFYEDVIKNSSSVDKTWKSCYSSEESCFWIPLSVKWWWRCSLRSYLMKTVSVLFGILSILVVWSECTFWVKKPTLSIFALIVQNASKTHNYFNLEVFCIFIISYLCFCAYSTLFQIKLFNIYFIAPNHQTDNYSLLFIGMFLCRLTPPLCLNFLGLIHMDSHITGLDDTDDKIDVEYTELMGHLDLVSDGFNIYFPILILLLCLGTWFKVGTRCLSSIGFAQFLQSDEFTSDLIEEGKALVNREKRRIEREWKKDDRDWNRKDTYRNRDREEPKIDEENVSLLQDTAVTDDNDNWTYRNERRPNRSLFDDV